MQALHQNRIRLAAALLAASAAWAQQTPITQGAQGFWERANGGSARLAPASRLVISTAGNVVVRGDDQPQLRFQFRQRVRAGSLDQAARLMGALAVSAETHGGLTTLTIVPDSALKVATDVEIQVPRGVSELIVENRLGGIEVRDVNASVQADTAGGPIRAGRIVGNLVARTGFGEIRLGQIGGSVRCSSGGGSVYLERSGGEANCATAGGDIVVDWTGGPLTASTEGGNIRVGYAAGTVRAHAVSGLIQVGQARGMVYADARGGTIQVDSAHGVQAESARGMVRVRNESGPLSLATAMGNILAELLGTGAADSSLVTGAGDITVRIPEQMGVSVRATSQAGITPRIISEFPEIHVHSIGFHSPLVGEGAINGGGPVLSLNASGGTIYLRKAQ